MAYGKAFIKQYKGKRVDVDGFPSVQPYQCYDLWMQFIKDNYGVKHNIIIRPSGFAKDIWKSFSALGLSKYFTRSKTPNVGDWVIYDDCRTWPQSHVAMVSKVLGDGRIELFGQNQAGHPEGTLITVSTQGVLGYLKPKKEDRGEMVSTVGVHRIMRLRLWRGGTKAELKKYVGKVTDDKLDELIMESSEYKKHVAAVKKSKCISVGALAQDYRKTFGSK